MLNCKQVSQLVSESLDRKLSFWNRTQLMMHLAMCGLCSRFSRVMMRVDQEVNSHAEAIQNGSSDSNLSLSAEARSRIEQAMKSQDS